MAYQENVLKENKLTIKSQLRFKSQLHDISTIKVDILALKNNGDKRVQNANSRKICVYGTSDKIMKK